jgi:hypothetical protein
MDTMTVAQGFTLIETITIRDYQDNPITTYTGTEVLSGAVRAGRALNPAVAGQGVVLTQPANLTWGNPAAGAIVVQVSASQTATLNPGQYLIQVGLTDSGGNNVDVYEGYLVVSYSAGTSILPPTYNSFDDLLVYAPWVQKLQTEVQVAGFAIERGLSRSWIDNIIVQHSNWMFLNPQIGQPGFMPLAMFPAMINQPPNLWLREQLNLNYLVRRHHVIAATAKKALYYIGRSQLDAMNEKQERLALFFGRDADKLVSSLRAEITLGVPYDPTKPNNGNEDTWPSVTVDCGRSSLRG